jgi:hypothetical protein
MYNMVTLNFPVASHIRQGHDAIQTPCAGSRHMLDLSGDFKSREYLCEISSDWKFSEMRILSKRKIFP